MPCFTNCSVSTYHNHLLISPSVLPCLGCFTVLKSELGMGDSNDGNITVCFFGSQLKSYWCDGVMKKNCLVIHDRHIWHFSAVQTWKNMEKWVRCCVPTNSVHAAHQYPNFGGSPATNHIIGGKDPSQCSPQDQYNCHIVPVDNKLRGTLHALWHMVT